MKKSIFLFFAAILCATSAWGADLQSGQYVYFEKPSDWTQVALLLGHSDYSIGYNMTTVANTNLYYWKTDSWGGYTQYAFIDAKDWGGQDWGDKEPNKRKTYAAHYSSTFYASSILIAQYHLFNTTKSIKSHASSYATAVNRTQTIKVQLKDGSNWVDATVVPADLKASTYALTSATATDAKSASLVKENTTVSATVDAAYSANVSLSCTNILDGYTFIGWYDGTTEKSTSTTYTYNATEAKTITARFSKEPKHTVTVSYKCGSTDVKLSETLEVGEVSAQTVTAEKIKDYTFSGWTLGAGVQSANPTANPISITTKSGETDYTLVANYDYIEPVIKTIYCKMEYDWWYSDGAAISAYVWGDEEGEWKSAPGALMALAPWETKVWKIDIDVARYPKVCFIRVKGDGSENWGAQTKDLVIPTDEKNLFTISNTDATWASSKCDGAWSVYTPAAVPDRYLTGNAAGFGMTIDGEGNEQWSPNTIKMTWNDATQKFTHTVSGLEANKYYKFRITDGTWAGKWGYSNLKSAIENVFKAEDNNISFVLAADGDLTITFDGTYIELTTTSSFAAPVYTIVGDAAVTGCHWDVNSVENQMVQDATDKNKFTLVKTVTAVAGEYEYKAIRNHSYDWEVASGTKLKIEKDGTGTITYTLDVSTKKLTAKVSDWEEEAVAQVVVLDGIGEQKTFVEAEDKKSTSVDVVLEANKVYDFSVIVNSVYMNNNGSMWRENCTNWAFEHGANRAHIITDLAGTYTFTWTYEGNKLSVKYPEGTNVPAPVFLKGTMNSWNDYSTRLIPSADGETASVTITLAKGSYEFGIILGDKYLSNTGTMDSNNSTGWTFEKLTDTNAKIQASLTGEYTFTWTYGDSKQLTVTYPTLPEMQSGKFSTGKYEYAEFAPGNLQYYTGDKSWRFAQHQYDYVGDDNINVGKEDYKGWIDLFGWSADDKFGVNPSNDNTNYQGEFVDWGTLFPEEGWSTLSKNQWNYLLNERTNAASLKQIAIVGETLGIMLFPDEWTLPAGCAPTKQTHHDEEDGEDHSCDFVSYNYTLAQWTELEKAGAIFLPAAGRRTGGWGNTKVSPHIVGTAGDKMDADGHYKHYADYYAYYWTSTKTDGKVNYLINCTLVDKVKDTYTVHAGHVNWAEEARYGQSVRLAKVTSTAYTRTVTNGNYGTICLPYASSNYTGMELYEVSWLKAETGLYLDQLAAGAQLVAGKPYIFKATATEITVTYTGDAKAAPVAGANGLTGTFTDIATGDAALVGNYIIAQNQIWVAGANNSLPANRAYINATLVPTTEQPKLAGRRRVCMGENAATGLDNITNGENTTIKVIENGQLIIIRNGEKFNAQGVRF